MIIVTLILHCSLAQDPLGPTPILIKHPRSNQHFNERNVIKLNENQNYSDFVRIQSAHTRVPVFAKRWLPPTKNSNEQESARVKKDGKVRQTQQNQNSTTNKPARKAHTHTNRQDFGASIFA